ncbi:MAG: M20/M25/M40 family metallo-hydrolase [Clostridia bacterium]|nr:M20/M25/M40 family metallo-hydrolase [Clostridia bacterium]
MEILNDKINEYLKNAIEETLALIETLCKIPAPSGLEDARAAFCKDWLEKQGARGVYIDAAKNVIYPVVCENAEKIALFSAHTDTVFPDLEPMSFLRDEKYLHSPGVGDDTTCLAVMLMIAKYIAQNGLKTKDYGVLIVANSCEEGLGNLKGIKQIMQDYAGKICRAYTFDGQYNALVNDCVGSHRYEITLKTEGGHSFRDFGNRNAIVAAARLICRLNECEIPVYENSRTTQNIGLITGGTSVNTIAQETEFFYEYRSNNAKCLAEMRAFFEEQIAWAQAENIAEITVNTVGIRPCADGVDQAILAEISRNAVEISQKHSGIACVCGAGSTDCNIPMSQGVPAVCVGSYLGSGEHTREEKVEIDSIPIGLKIAAELILQYFDQE